jgi:hypothetical protein
VEIVAVCKGNPAHALEGNPVEGEPTVMDRYALEIIGIM